MTVENAILEFEAVRYCRPEEPFCMLEGAGFALHPGDLLEVQVDHDSEQAPLLELATGLVVPTEGTIRFAGQDWQARTMREQENARGRIGVVPDMPDWIASLTLRQNIVLRERHHTHRPEAELHAEADELARLAGLPAVPDRRPDGMPPRTLRTLEWIRAFIGNPALLLLAFPGRGVEHRHREGLAALVARARRQGAAVLWISDQQDHWPHIAPGAATHASLEHQQWNMRSTQEEPTR